MAGNIWIINEHLTTPDLSENGHSRHYSLGSEFIKNGYDVSLITSSFSHNPRRKVPLSGLLKTIDGRIRTLVIKGFGYSQSSSFVRIINWVLFFKLCFLAPFTRLPKPDIIILSSTPMLPVYNVLYFRMIYPKCKFIFETRDLWPLTPMRIGNYSEKSIFIHVLKHLEYKCYSKADYIVSVLKNSDEHIKELLGKKDFNFKWISNGIDLQNFSENQQDKNWDFVRNIGHKDAFIVGYAGTLGKANAMEYIVRAFNDFFNGSKYYLVILGDGGEKESLVAEAEGNYNIIFLDTVQREYLMSFYNRCDVLYLSWRNLDLYKYGVSANKIFEYMFAKKPVLMSCNIPKNIIEVSNCGLTSMPENRGDIKEKIIEMAQWSEAQRSEKGQNGYSCLTSKFTYEKLAQDYITVFRELHFSVPGSRRR